MRKEEDLGALSALATGHDEGAITDPHKVEPPHYPTTRAEWATFPVTRTAYNDGVVKGERLLIDGWSVMEEWEKPMERATAARLLADTHGPAKVLIRGEGLGYATQAFIEGLRDRGGGEIHIIELHPEIIDQGKRRAERFLRTLAPEEKSSIKIEWHLGDALEVTKTFPDNYFDAIRSDTFPLSPDEKDVNDMVDIQEQVRILKSTGAFSPFIGHPSLTAEQFRYINGNHFRQIVQEVFPTRPPRDCPYYQKKEMAIVICKGPKQNGADAVRLPN